ncbi:MAG: filamentous hemagglutinin, partial [Hyphomicrobiales bacterium]
VAGLGNSGTFTVDARNVVFGFGANATPDTRTTFDRLMLGFQSVAFNASNSVSANGLGSISAYLTGPATASGFTPASYAGSGGTLTFNTPVMTGAAGALLNVYGNAVSVVAPSGSASTATGGLGAELNITGSTLQVASAILLPGGALSLTSTQNLIVDSGARLDLSGGTVTYYDASSNVWGGDVRLTSLAGDVVVRQGATIDVSSKNTDAGSLTVKAAGTALLQGTLSATGGKDANGGAIDITAASFGSGTLSADFAALNRTLTAAGYSYSRAFRLTQGNLVVGDDVAARNVTITTEGGSLTIDGRIDATGVGPGAIRLAARDDLTLTSRAVLDGRDTGLVVDSYGQAIEASNRTSIELTSSQGWIRLNSGTSIDLTSTDGVARGRVEINARRVSETGGDVKIDASGALGLRGIASLGVNAFWTYSPTDASGSVVQDSTVSGTPSGAVGLAQIDAQNQVFYANALGNADLQRRLGGLSGLGSAYHLRPGVEITSSAASGGKLTVASNLELSGYRYGPNADRNAASATYGYGEAMALTLRASGDLVVKGRISDGFGTVAITDPNYFTLSTTQTLTTATTLSSAVYVSSSTRVPLTTLNFAITIGSATVKGGAAIPFQFTTTAQIPTVRNGWTTTANIYDTAGNLAYAAGTLIKTQIPASYTFAAGTVLPSTVTVGVYSGTVVPAGTNLATYFSGSIYLQDGSTIAAGATLPSGTVLQTRILTQDPSLTRMLAAGAQSASLRLVSGADLTSADSRSLRSLLDLSGAGNLDLTGTKLIRTGVGSLELLAGGSIVQTSNAAIYTAGTQTVLDTNDSAYHPATATGVVSPNYYPDHGGDLLIKAQKDFTGADTNPPAQAAAQWLVMQGANELGQLGAWSIAFGDNKAYTASTNGFGTASGFGTFGGGNVTIDVGGNVTNVDATIASTGRVLANGSLLETGGGSLTVRVRGSDTGGALTQLRGDVSVATGSYGSVTPAYATKVPNDPRSIDTSVAALMSASAIGPSLYLGDAAVTVDARRDVAMTEVVDPGTDHMLYYYYKPSGAYYALAGRYAYPAQGRTQSSWFSLWQPTTSLDMVALGGNVALSAVANGANLLPPQFRAAATSGSIYAMYPVQSNGNVYGIGLEQAPAANSSLELLAMGGMYGNGSGIKMSAANATQIPTVFHPAYAIYLSYKAIGTNTLSTPSVDGTVYDPVTQTPITVIVPSFNLFGFTTDTATTNLHAGDTDPARIYAVNGDIIGLNFNLAKVGDIHAGRDIVSTNSTIINANTTDVSQVTVGRDLIYANLAVSGPGALDVTAGRNVYLGNVGSIQSNGPAYAGDLRPGASISVTAGAASGGPDYAAVAALYLDPANLAVAGTPLVDQPGKVAKTYDKELIAWLKSRYSYEAKDAADAIGYFGKLAPEQQHVFLRQVYFAELDAGGREFNDTSSTRYKSYIRGRQMIAALFPEVDKNGKPISYAGDIVMFGKAGVRSVSGGDIALLAPDGKVTIGVDGKVPASTAGVITQGAGDIDIYSKGSVQLGLSRIMTTFGGDILVWSAEGDINSGRGAKTTLVFTPPKRTYSPYGLVTLSPTVPATGAGIATLNPIPEVPPGDINLIAPLGVIDAGEAGIRVSGNVNVAALQIVNAANIQVQ